MYEGVQTVAKWIEDLSSEQEKAKDKDDGTVKEKDAVDDILEDARPGRETKGRTKQWEKKGGYEQAKRDFDRLNPKNVRNMPGRDGKVGDLPDGRKVNVRNHSKQGSPTLEIQKGSAKIKIRYK